METEYDIYKGLLRESILVLALKDAQEKTSSSPNKAIRDFVVALKDYKEYSPASNKKKQVAELALLDELIGSADEAISKSFDVNDFESEVFKAISVKAMDVIRAFHW